MQTFITSSWKHLQYELLLKEVASLH